jgi:hypothetical protein
MMQQDRQNAQQQNQMSLQRGQYEAQKAAADIAKDSAWTRGLDAATKNFLPAMESTSRMGIAKQQLTETQKTGEANRANLMEQTLGQRAKNELDAQFGRRDREAALGMTEAQTRGIGITNRQGELAVNKAQREEEFANADAAQAGLPEAKPGETVSQYTMRNNAIGDISKVKLVEAQARKEGIDADFMPRRLKLEEQTSLANIAYQRGSLGIQAQDLALRRQQDARAGDQYSFEMKQKKKDIAATDYAAYLAGLENGSIGAGEGQPPLTVGEKIDLAANKLDNIMQSFNGTPDEKAAFYSRVVMMNKNNEIAAKAARNVSAQQDPVQRQAIEKNTAMVNKLTATNALMNNLNAINEKYKAGAGRFMNSDDAKFRADQIQTVLDNAAAQVPEFGPFAKQFKAANARFLENPLQAAQNLFGPSIDVQTDAILEAISAMTLNDVKGSGLVLPEFAPVIQQMTSQLSRSANDLAKHDSYGSMQKPQFNQNQMPVIPQFTNNQKPENTYGVGRR